MTDIIEVVADETLVNQAVLVAQFVKTIMGEKERVAGELAARFAKGDKKTAHAMNGSPLGTVSMSDPAAKAEIVDVEVFEGWVRSEYADQLETVLGFGPADAVAAVLAEHAPELLTSEQVIPAWLRSNLLTMAAKEDIPGTRSVRPAGSISIRPNANAAQIVREILQESSYPMLAVES